MTLHFLHADVGMPALVLRIVSARVSMAEYQDNDWKTQYFKDKLATASSARESLECW